MTSPSTIESPTTTELPDTSAQIICSFCDQPAVYRSLGHSRTCRSPDTNQPPPFYRCTPCYDDMRSRNTRILNLTGKLFCRSCINVYTSIDTYAPYHRF